MRELKFRAWDKKNKIMIYQHNIDEIIERFEGKDYLYGSEEFYPWADINLLNGIQTLQKEYKNRLIIMQYTGLKDKNGKEIYEGDILKSITMDGKVYYEPVKFDNGCFCKLTKLPGTNKKIWTNLRHHLYKRKLIAYEIVGNIFENPELLEK